MKYLPILPVERAGVGIFMDKLKISENARKYIQISLVILGVYFGMKYISPIVSPFLLAFLFTGIINPLVSGLHQKLKIKKSVLAGVILFLMAGLVFLLLWFFLSLLWSGGQNLALKLPDFQKEFGVFLNDCCCRLEDKFGIDGVVIENFILEQVDVFVENMEVEVFPAVMGKSFDYIKSIVSGISFFIVMMIAVLLMMKDYGKLVDKLKSEKELEGVRTVCKKVVVFCQSTGYYFADHQYNLRRDFRGHRDERRHFLWSADGLYGYATFCGNGDHADPISACYGFWGKGLAGGGLFCSVCGVCIGQGISGAKADRG